MNRPGIASIGIAGTGRLAQALGRLLVERGWPVAVIAGRDSGRTLSDRTLSAARFIGNTVRAVAMSELPRLASHLLIAVPDDGVASVAEILAASPASVAAGVSIKVALHTCGAKGPEVLAALADRGTSCGTIHPLQTISTQDQGVADLPGSYFGITGDGEALGWALDLCGALQGHPLVIPAERRSLYHAAAVMASNYIVAMIDAAAALLVEAGVEPDQALPALAPLIQASVRNTLNTGPVRALTGPIERGDAQTVASHLQALREAPESVRHLYRSAGLHALEIARRKFPDVDRGSIESLLRENQKMNP